MAQVDRGAAQEIRLHSTDGFSLAATLHSAARPDAALVIAPALGVPRKFYAPFARYLAARGYAVLSFDYRGIADSARGSLRGRRMRLRHWGERDLEAALRYAFDELRAPKTFLLGHSAGGQLLGLAPSSERLAGAVLVAATAPHPRLYPVPTRWGIALLTRLAVPLSVIGRDQVSGRWLGLGPGKIPSGVLAQWARWVRTPGYLFNPTHGIDTTRYAKLALPLLSWHFTDDHFAPAAAVRALLAHYPAARIDARSVAPPQGAALGHFGFFRETQRDMLWKETVSFLHAQL